MKPAAMLVAAFDIEVGTRKFSLGSAIEHRVPARTRLEPHVEDVHLFAKVVAIGVAAAGADRPMRQQGRRRRAYTGRPPIPFLNSIHDRLISFSDGDFSAS